MTHYLLTTMFSAGDVIPFVRLGRQLLGSGHRVTVGTHETYRGLVETAGLAFASWDTADEHAAMMADGPLFNDIVGFETIYRRYVVPKLAREVAALRDHTAPDTVIVARCGPALAPRIVAEQRDVPLVELYLGPGHVSPPEVVAEFVRPFAPEIASVRGADPLPRGWMTSCNARVGVWPAWFAPPAAHWPPDLQLTGFVPAHDAPASALDPALVAMLDGRRTILLATGTGRFLTREVVEACAAAADALGARLILVTPFDDLVPSPLPGHVHRFHAAPYSLLVPAMSLLVHHGGIGTTTDALRAGVPQIALGSGGDRPVNAACLARLGVGRYVPPAEWNADALTRAARELLDTAVTRAACDDAAQRLRADPVDATVRALESVERVGFAALLARAPREAAPSADGSLRARLAKLTPEQRARLLKK